MALSALSMRKVHRSDTLVHFCCMVISFYFISLICFVSVLVTGFYTNDECLKKYNKTGASYKIGKRITEAVDLVLNQGVG